MEEPRQLDPSHAESGWAPSKTRTKPETTLRDLQHVGPCTENHNDIVGIRCWPNSLNMCLMKFLQALSEDLFLPLPRHVMWKSRRSQVARSFIDCTRKKIPSALHNCTEFNSRAEWDLALGLLLRAWMGKQARGWRRGGDEHTVSLRHSLSDQPPHPPK